MIFTDIDPTEAFSRLLFALHGEDEDGFHEMRHALILAGWKIESLPGEPFGRAEIVSLTTVFSLAVDAQGRRRKEFLEGLARKGWVVKKVNPALALMGFEEVEIETADEPEPIEPPAPKPQPEVIAYFEGGKVVYLNPERDDPDYSPPDPA